MIKTCFPNNAFVSLLLPLSLIADQIKFGSFCTMGRYNANDNRRTLTTLMFLLPPPLPKADLFALVRLKPKADQNPPRRTSSFKILLVRIATPVLPLAVVKPPLALWFKNR